MKEFIYAAGVTANTHGFQSFPWWGWLLVGIILGFIVHGKWGH